MSAGIHDLSGRVAVVTGGSRGLGRAIVQALAEAGADIVVASRKADVCETVAADLRESTGRRAIGAGYHAAVWDDAEQLMQTTLDKFGRLDILVNNAGMSPTYSSLESISEELYDKTLGVNLKGPFRLSVLAAVHMRDNAGGSIVNIGTAGSLVASAPQLPYAAAKAGLNALTVGLADAFAPQVRVNAVLPGPFRTDATVGWAPQPGEPVPFVPLGRMGEPAELAPLVVHLAGDASSFTTGAIIRVDGGFTKKV